MGWGGVGWGGVGWGGVGWGLTAYLLPPASWRLQKLCVYCCAFVCVVCWKGPCPSLQLILNHSCFYSSHRMCCQGLRNCGRGACLKADHCCTVSYIHLTEASIYLHKHTWQSPLSHLSSGQWTRLAQARPEIEWIQENRCQKETGFRNMQLGDGVASLCSRSCL